jgi:hypothetical protein
MSQIFISYRKAEDGFAAVAIDERLCEHFGADRVFRDSRTIMPGVDFGPDLWRTLAHSAVLAVVVGPRWLTAGLDGRRRIDNPDDFVRREIALALEIDKPVIPILLADAPQLAAEALPDNIRALASHQYVRIYPRTFEHDMRRLIEALEKILRLRAGASIAGRHTVVAAQAGPAGGHGDPDVTGLLRRAVADAGAPLGDPPVRRYADTAVALLPDAVPPVAALTELVPALRALLTRHAELATDAPRVRVAVHRGEVAEAGGRLSGEAVELAELMLSDPALDLVYAAATPAPLVLAVSEEFYRGVVLPAYARIDASTYGRFALRGGGAPGARSAWAHVPGRSAPPGLPPYPPPDGAGQRPAQGAPPADGARPAEGAPPAQGARPDGAGQGPSAGEARGEPPVDAVARRDGGPLATNINYGTLNGHQVGGDVIGGIHIAGNNHVAGDQVAGDKHVSNGRRAAP